MNRKIIKYPNPILRKKSEEIKEITPEVKELASDMTELMRNNQGIGIAAPQVGESKRIIVVQTEKGPQVLVNPRILKKGRDKDVMEEGCLCLPGLFLRIKREREVEAEALHLDGEKILIKAKGLLARILQHEIDHLDGILFIDKISFWQKIWQKIKNLK